MITLFDITVLLITHFIADFICQTDRMAKGKSTSNLVLSEHVLVYSMPFILMGFIIPISYLFLILNFIGHWCTDYVTSRITSKLWKEGKVHWFFVVIGADQLIHALTLIWTYEYCGWYW